MAISLELAMKLYTPRINSPEGMIYNKHNLGLLREPVVKPTTDFTDNETLITDNTAEVLQALGYELFASRGRPFITYFQSMTDVQGNDWDMITVVWDYDPKLALIDADKALEEIEIEGMKVAGKGVTVGSIVDRPEVKRMDLTQNGAWTPLALLVNPDPNRYGLKPQWESYVKSLGKPEDDMTLEETVIFAMCHAS